MNITGFGGQIYGWSALQQLKSITILRRKFKDRARKNAKICISLPQYIGVNNNTAYLEMIKVSRSPCCAIVIDQDIKQLPYITMCTQGARLDCILGCVTFGLNIVSSNHVIEANLSTNQVGTLLIHSSESKL